MKPRAPALLFVPLLVLGLGLCLNSAPAFELEAVRSSDGAHALIGPTAGRTHENHALNANFGVIDTPDGTLLIDSAASRGAAQ